MPGDEQQVHLSKIRRIKMNQMSKDIHHSLVQLHLVQTKNKIHSLTFQDNKTSCKCSPKMLE
jgi:hypothetical protein